MNCSKCGSNNQEAAAFCANCGNDMQSLPPVDNQAPIEALGVKKPNNKKLIIIIVIGLLLILGSITGYALFNQSGGRTNNKDELIPEMVLNDLGIPKYLDGTFMDLKINSKNDVLNGLNKVKDLFKIKDVNNEFKVLDEEKSENNSYYKLQQMYQNIPVYGQQLIISVNKEGNVLSITGEYINDIDLNITPIFTKENAVSKIKPTTDNEFEVINNELFVYADYGHYNLVYIIDTVGTGTSVRYIVDANNGEIISISDLITYATYPYSGIDLNGNKVDIILEECTNGIISPKTTYHFFDSKRKINITHATLFGPDITGIASISFSRFLNWVGSAGGLLGCGGAYTIAGDMKNNELVFSTYSEKTIKTSVSTMKNFTEIYDYYESVLNRKSFDNKEGMIFVIIGMKESTLSMKPWENAAWFPLGEYFFIGEYHGNPLIYKDVLGHEFTHAVVEHTAKFAHSPKASQYNEPFETGILNEGYADIIGLLINGKGFILGEGTPIEERGGRDLTNPNKYDAPAVKGGDYWFPDYYLKDYASLAEFLKEKDAERKAKGEKNEIKYLKDIDKGGVHHNSTVVGHAAYLMNKAGAFSSKEQMAKVWYNSLFMLSSRANFEDCALAVIKTAQNFNLSEASIKIIRNAFMDTKMLEDTNFKVSGQVKDDSNKVLSNVKVTLTHKVNSSITYSTNTNNSGNYNFEHIPRGPYVIMAVKASYNDASEDLVGIAGETKELNLQMSKVKENSTSPNNEDFSGVAFFRGKLKCDEIKNREMKVLNLGGASSDQKVNPKAYYGYILTADWHLYGLYEKEVADGYEYTCTREFNNLNILGAGIEGNNYVCSSDSDKIYNLNGSEYTPIGWHNLECYVHRKYRNSSMDPIYVRDNIDFLNTDYYSGFENEGSDAKGKYYSTVWSTRLIAVVKEDGIYLESYKEITKHYAGPSNAKEVFQTLHDSKLFLPQKEFDGKIISVKSTFYGQINQKNIPPIIIKTDKSYYGYIRDNYECEQSNKCTYKLTKIKVLSNNYNKIVYADRWGFVDNNYNVYIYSFIDNEFHSN